jgi:hypothetical protein
MEYVMYYISTEYGHVIPLYITTVLAKELFSLLRDHGTIPDYMENHVPF